MWDKISSTNSAEGKSKKKNANASENTVNSVTVKTAHYTEHSIAPPI